MKQVFCFFAWCASILKPGCLFVGGNYWWRIYGSVWSAGTQRDTSRVRGGTHVAGAAGRGGPLPYPPSASRTTKIKNWASFWYVLLNLFMYHRPTERIMVIFFATQPRLLHSFKLVNFLLYEYQKQLILYSIHLQLWVDIKIYLSFVRDLIRPNQLGAESWSLNTVVYDMIIAY